MKPKAIDQHMWNEIYNVYVKDKHNLGTKEFFEKQSPAALEEMTAVMMETIRKGMWKATPQQTADIARLHVEMVNKHKPSCSGFVCDNAKLRQFIASKTDAASAREYQANVENIRQEQLADGKKSTVMKKETLNDDSNKTKAVVSGVLVAAIAIVAVIAIVVLIRRRRKSLDTSL